MIFVHFEILLLHQDIFLQKDVSFEKLDSFAGLERQVDQLKDLIQKPILTPTQFVHRKSSIPTRIKSYTLQVCISFF